MCGGGVNMETCRAPLRSTKEEENFTIDYVEDAGIKEFFIEDVGVREFLNSVRFFTTPRPIAQKILLLNQELGDSIIDGEIAALSSGQTPPSEHQVFERNETWVNSIIRKISSVLFHEEEPSPEQADVAGEELSFFQKTVSERIYDHLSLLSLSPHAKSGRAFSIKEELTDGVAEDLGLGVYRQTQIPAELRKRTELALHDLAGEFQHWLTEDRGGVYSAGWGEIRSTTLRNEACPPSGTVIWLEPDVQAQQLTSVPYGVATASTG